MSFVKSVLRKVGIDKRSITEKFFEGVSDAASGTLNALGKIGENIRREREAEARIQNAERRDREARSAKATELRFAADLLDGSLPQVVYLGVDTVAQEIHKAIYATVAGAYNEHPRFTFDVAKAVSEWNKNFGTFATVEVTVVGRYNIIKKNVLVQNVGGRITATMPWF